MSWKTSNEIPTRGYKFSYDNLSRLTAANYLEGGSTNDHFNTAYAYDKQGNMTSLSRRGNTGTSTYGNIDVLTMTYAGNQLAKAEDAGSSVSLSASMDFKNNSNAVKEYSYDANGNLIQDLNKGINSITYNLLNLPQTLTISNSLGSATNSYTYAADGRKLKAVIGGKVTDYCGNVIYENGVLKRILVEGGYIEGGAYYFYLTDHLGNNRVIANASGTVVQTNHYYPFGMSFAEGIQTSPQPYKYNGKELDTDRGLNLYDYSARYMDPALGRFNTVDPMAEKYYSISPYAYVRNNPIKFIDPDGQEIVFMIKTSSETSRYQYMADGNLKNISTGKMYSSSSIGGNVGLIIDGYTKMLNIGDGNYVKQVTTLIDSKNVHEINATISSDDNSGVQMGSRTISVSEAENKAKKGEGIGTTTTYGDLSKNKLNNSDVGKTNYTTVAHEVQHQYDYDQGKMKDSWDKNGRRIKGQNSAAEQRAMKNEDKAREEENLERRRIY